MAQALAAPREAGPGHGGGAGLRPGWVIVLDGWIGCLYVSFHLCTLLIRLHSPSPQTIHPNSNTAYTTAGTLRHLAAAASPHSSSSSSSSSTAAAASSTIGRGGGRGRWGGRGGRGAGRGGRGDGGKAAKIEEVRYVEANILALPKPVDETVRRATAAWDVCMCRERQQHTLPLFHRHRHNTPIQSTTGVPLPPLHQRARLAGVAAGDGLRGRQRLLRGGLHPGAAPQVRAFSFFLSFFLP